MSSITLKVVSLIDKSKVQKLFIENESSLYFAPLRIRLNTNSIESLINKVVSIDGNTYRPNQFEKNIINDLDF